MKTLTTFFIGLFVSISLASSSLTVAFNTKTLKYHPTFLDPKRRFLDLARAFDTRWARIAG
jgi:hypothetical protein